MSKNLTERTPAGSESIETPPPVVTIAELALPGPEGAPCDLFTPQQALTVRIELDVRLELVFDVTLSLAFYSVESGALRYAANLQRDGWDVCWLPRGRYTATCRFPSLRLL